MRLRSLSVSVLSALVLLPVCGTAASASPLVTRDTALSASPFKNSNTKRTSFIGPVAAPVAPRATVAAPAPARTVNGAQAYQDEVLVRTNAERTSRGLRALRPSTCADRYADTWAGKLAAVGSLSHQALSPILSSCAARGVGENVAFGNVTPAQLVTMWMNSPGHRANILKAGYTHLGVGSLTTGSGRTYGVQVFLTL